jgi:hypothetical protein
MNKNMRRGFSCPHRACPGIPNLILETGAPHSIEKISAAAKLANAIGEQLLLDAPTDHVKKSVEVLWSRPTSNLSDMEHLSSRHLWQQEILDRYTSADSGYETVCP